MATAETNLIPERDFRRRRGQLMEEVRAYRAAAVEYRQASARQSAVEASTIDVIAPDGDTDR